MTNLKLSFFLCGLALLSFCFLLGCASEESVENKPEAIARQWQNYVDENQFKQAKKLSAPNAIEWLDWISETLTEEILKEEAGLSPGSILEMTCVENGNKASCPYTFDDNGFVYKDTFKLLKIKGRWLVDIPVEALSESSDIDALFQETPEPQTQQ